MKISRDALIWTLKLLRSDFPPDTTAPALAQSVQIIFKRTGTIDFIAIGQRQAAKISLRNYGNAPCDDTYFHFNLKDIDKVVNLTDGTDDILGIKLGIEQGVSLLYLTQGVCDSLYAEVKGGWVEDTFPSIAPYFSTTEGLIFQLAMFHELPPGITDMRIGFLK